MFGNLAPGQWKRLLASALVKKAGGRANLTGLICSTSSSLVISIYDGIDNTGSPVCKAMPVAAATPYPMPALLNVGLYVEFVSGTGDITVFFD